MNRLRLNIIILSDNMNFPFNLKSLSMNNLSRTFFSTLTLLLYLLQVLVHSHSIQASIAIHVWILCQDPSFHKEVNPYQSHLYVGNRPLRTWHLMISNSMIIPSSFSPMNTYPLECSLYLIKIHFLPLRLNFHIFEKDCEHKPLTPKVANN